MKGPHDGLFLWLPDSGLVLQHQNVHQLQTHAANPRPASPSVGDAAVLTGTSSLEDAMDEHMPLVINSARFSQGQADKLKLGMHAWAP